MRVQALAVCERQLAKKLSDLTIFSRPESHVPVIWHHAISQGLNSHPICRINDRPLERLTISIVLKDLATRISTVKYVKDESA